MKNDVLWTKWQEKKRSGETNYINKLLKNIVVVPIFLQLNHETDSDFKQILDNKTKSSGIIQ